MYPVKIQQIQDLNKHMLYDNHNRQINYIRLAVTDRCNLRCFYCMPEEGISYMDREELLTFEEMERLLRVFSNLGISKLRITGGEPFVRKGIMEFLERIAGLPQLEQIHLTTNGTLTKSFIPRLAAIGIRSVNLSLDTLDKKRFYEITRRDLFDRVMNTFHSLLDHQFNVKLNMVVMDGKNIEDIIPMIELTKTHPVSVRFIEEMPFNGTSGQGNATYWPMPKILEYIRDYYPGLEKIDDQPFSTSTNFKVPGYLGSFGIIAAYSRTFCGTCNRIRITPQGKLRTCLYDDGRLNLRDLVRQGATDEQLEEALASALSMRAKDGFEAEKRRFPGQTVSESMATIGG